MKRRPEPLSTTFAIMAMEQQLAGNLQLAEALRVKAQEHRAWEDREEECKRG